jgi:hypothetical protein
VYVGGHEDFEPPSNAGIPSAKGKMGTGKQYVIGLALFTAGRMKTENLGSDWYF